jgi:hypothetical protein
VEGYYAAQIRVTTQLGGMPTSQTMYRCEGVKNKALRCLDLNFVADLGHSFLREGAQTRSGHILSWCQPQRLDRLCNQKSRIVAIFEIFALYYAMPANVTERA